jgi:hypothetical protein
MPSDSSVLRFSDWNQQLALFLCYLVCYRFLIRSSNYFDFNEVRMRASAYIALLYRPPLHYFLKTIATPFPPNYHKSFYYYYTSWSIANPDISPIDHLFLMFLAIPILYAVAAAAAVAEPRGACNHDNCLRGDYHIDHSSNTLVLRLI